MYFQIKETKIDYITSKKNQRPIFSLGVYNSLRDIKINMCSNLMYTDFSII